MSCELFLLFTTGAEQKLALDMHVDAKIHCISTALCLIVIAAPASLYQHISPWLLATITQLASDGKLREVLLRTTISMHDNICHAWQNNPSAAFAALQAQCACVTA